MRGQWALYAKVVQQCLGQVPPQDGQEELESGQSGNGGPLWGNLEAAGTILTGDSGKQV